MWWVSGVARVTVVNTKRTNVRTTLTTTHANVSAILFAVSLRSVTGVPYGPSVKNAKGKRLICRVSTLNNRVKHTTSEIALRSHALGLNGNTTIRSGEVRTSQGGCRSVVGRALRGARSLHLIRTRVITVNIRSNGIASIAAGLNRI